MAWVDIPDFADEGIVRAETFQDMWGNLNHLKAPMFVQNQLTDNANSWPITGSSFVDVDGTKLRLQFESYGNDVLIGVMIDHFHSATGGAASYTFELDGVKQGNTNGLGRIQRYATAPEHVNQLLYIAEDLEAGEHTIDVQFANVTAGTATYFEDTANKFFVQEY